MFPIPLPCRAGARLAVAGAVLGCSLAVAADEPERLELEAPRFAVLSQLDEAETSAWAVDLDRFVAAMDAVYPVDEAALPPLTIVLFRDARDFAPYRLRTSSGQARVAAFFGNTGDWSIVGMPRGGRDEATGQTLYHEAVHWLTAASDDAPPRWFAEGLAEALSTFEVVDGQGRWGNVVEENVAVLRRDGVPPIGELLGASQDETLLGPGGDRCYAQAWTFVHRMRFANGGADAARLAAFLRALRTTDAETAAAASFGSSLGELTSDLRRSLDRGRYGFAEVALAQDAAALRAGRALYPTDGLLLVAAAAAKATGDAREASRLLARAAAEPSTLPKRYRAAVAALRSRWLGESLSSLAAPNAAP